MYAVAVVMVARRARARAVRVWFCSKTPEYGAFCFECLIGCNFRSD